LRPLRAPLHPRLPERTPAGDLRPIASALVAPVGPGYDPALRLRRRAVALRGGPDALVVALSWAAGKVRVRVLASGGCSSDDAERAIEVARGLGALDDDPREFLGMVRGHPILGPLVHADVRLARSPTLFESLAIAIIEQLVTGFEARASIRRLWRIAGAPVAGTKLVAAPSPVAVHRVPMWKMHEIGIGARRAVTLHAAAGRGAAIERLRDLPPPVMIEKLETLPGIGPWTSNAVARNALGWADAVPISDFHAPFTISAALGGPMLPRSELAAANASMLERLEPFRPHRARVALLLEAQALRETRWRPPRVDAHRREPWRH